MAKLRMHIDPTLDILDALTIKIGVEFRAFISKTCPAFETYELSRETEARKRREAKKRRGDGCNEKSCTTTRQKGPKPRVLNIQTYKYYSLGDYGATIRRLGTTDSYSTEVVSEFYSQLSILN